MFSDLNITKIYCSFTLLGPKLKSKYDPICTIKWNKINLTRKKSPMLLKQLMQLDIVTQISWIL